MKSTHTQWESVGYNICTVLSRHHPSSIPHVRYCWSMRLVSGSYMRIKTYHRGNELRLEVTHCLDLYVHHTVQTYTRCVRLALSPGLPCIQCLITYSAHKWWKNSLLLQTVSNPQTPPSHKEKHPGEPTQIYWAVTSSNFVCHALRTFLL